MPSPRTKRATTRKMNPGASAEATAPTIMMAATTVYTVLRPSTSAIRPNTKAPKKAARIAEPGHPTGLGGGQVPLGLDQGRHRGDHEQVVGVGEEAHPRDEHGPMVEPAGRGLVEEVADRQPGGSQAGLRNRVVGAPYVTVCPNRRWPRCVYLGHRVLPLLDWTGPEGPRSTWPPT